MPVSTVQSIEAAEAMPVSTVQSIEAAEAMPLSRNFTSEVDVLEVDEEEVLEVEEEEVLEVEEEVLEVEEEVLEEEEEEEAPAISEPTNCGIFTDSKSRVSALSLGLEVAGGCMSVVIPRNSKLPCSGRVHCATSVDDQTGLNLRVFQGERILTRDNHFVTDVTFGDIRPAKKGVAYIEIGFSLNEDGILTITGFDREKGVSPEFLIFIDMNNILDQEEILKMIQDAEEHKAFDEDIARKSELEQQLHLIQGQINQQCDEEAKSMARSIMSWINKDLVEEKIDSLLEKRQSLQKLLDTRKISAGTEKKKKRRSSFLCFGRTSGFSRCRATTKYERTW